MAASKDNEDNKDKATESATTAETKESKSLAGTYKILRGSFSSFASKDMKRDERLVPNGPLVSVSYKKGDRIRYEASDETRNVADLSTEQARRFLFEPSGKRVDPPRIEKV